MDLVGDKGPSQLPPLQRVSYSATGTTDIEPFGISFSANATRVTVQTPLTRQEATSEALSGTEWTLEGLDNYPNPVVMLGATAAAVPISLWEQSVAIVRGLSPKQVREASAKLDEVAARTRPGQELGFQVARQLAPGLSEPAVMAKYVVAESTSPTPTSGMSLEIHVEGAALGGTGGINSKLALCVEAKATLRSGNGEQLYSCPVQYRSKEGRFTEWAANDAHLFRNELKECYQTLGTAIVDQLVARGMVPQSSPPRTMYAKD